jgi:hypothetical protein
MRFLGHGILVSDLLLVILLVLISIFYIGLVGVAFAGFLSAIMCLCMVGEYLVGLRTVTKIRQKLQKPQFVELTKIDPSKNEKKKCSNDYNDVQYNRIAV